MRTVQFINPDESVVEVPESDAAHFDKLGWKRVNGTRVDTGASDDEDDDADTQDAGDRRRRKHNRNK